MTVPSVVIGLLMIGVGAFGYLNAEVKEDGTKPMTALIPALFGAVILLCGLIVMAKPTLRKHVMHVAALVGLFGIFGGFMPIWRQTVKLGQPFDPSKPSIISGLSLTVLSLLFVVLCVKSFIHARKARQAQAPS